LGTRVAVGEGGAGLGEGEALGVGVGLANWVAVAAGVLCGRGEGVGVKARAATRVISERGSGMLKGEVAAGVPTTDGGVEASQALKAIPRSSNPSH